MEVVNEIITELPGSFIDEFERDILGKIPEEKVQVQLRQLQNAKIMQSLGSLRVEGLGQVAAQIDPRLYFRMAKDFGGHEGWLDDLLCDNPELCAPGYVPRRRRGSSLRHGKSFMNGQPI